VAIGRLWFASFSYRYSSYYSQLSVAGLLTFTFYSTWRNQSKPLDLSDLFCIPRVPAQISKCGHIGCMSCLLRHLQVSGVTRNEWEQRTMVCCPYCRVDFAEDNLKIYSTWQPLSKAVIGLVKARCSLGSSSTAVTCSWSGPITNLLHHETYECPARQIVCPNLFCKYTDSESKVKQHFGTCSYLQVRCVECCLPFRWVSRDKHDCKQALKDAPRGKSSIIKI